jgi:Holliday junction resolvase RusA-like endonuclease
MIRIIIPGRVGGKGRPRFARRGKFMTTYSPEKTVNAEAMVRRFGADAMLARPPMQGPLGMRIEIIANTPASWSKKKKACANYMTGKPDLDNCVKLFGDALNGVVWSDDSQIAKLDVSRRYDDKSAEFVMITIWHLQDPFENATHLLSAET